jgi:hypothetical protein
MERTAMPTITTKNLPSREERAEIGKKARAIYEPLREKLEKDHWGEYITINVDNGDYIVALDDVAAARAIKAKYPGTIPFTIRIGYKAVAHFGGTGVSDGVRHD